MLTEVKYYLVICIRIKFCEREGGKRVESVVILTANVMIDEKIRAVFCICPHSVATSCDFTFWLHVILTDTSPPLEGTVSTVSVTLSKWEREIQTGGSRGTEELKMSSFPCAVPIYVFLSNCSYVLVDNVILCQSKVIISNVEYCRASTQTIWVGLNTAGNTLILKWQSWGSCWIPLHFSSSDSNFRKQACVHITDFLCWANNHTFPHLLRAPQCLESFKTGLRSWKAFTSAVDFKSL